MNVTFHAQKICKSIEVAVKILHVNEAFSLVIVEKPLRKQFICAYNEGVNNINWDKSSMKGHPIRSGAYH